MPLLLQGTEGSLFQGRAVSDHLDVEAAVARSPGDLDTSNRWCYLLPTTLSGHACSLTATSVPRLLLSVFVFLLGFSSNYVSSRAHSCTSLLLFWWVVAHRVTVCDVLVCASSVCFRCRGVLQVALAAMEAHQRTSSLAGSGWPETVAAERVQLRQLRFVEEKAGRCCGRFGSSVLGRERGVKVSREWFRYCSEIRYAYRRIIYVVKVPWCLCHGQARCSVSAHESLRYTAQRGVA